MARTKGKSLAPAKNQSNVNVEVTKNLRSFINTTGVLPVEGAVDNISDTSDFEDHHWSQLDQEPPGEISLTSEDDEAQQDQPGPSQVLKKARYHGVRQMLSCRVVQQPGQRVFNALTEEGLNAYIVETIYRHWEESNTLFFGIVCPKQVSLEPAKNVKHALARVNSYLRTKPEETKIVLRDLLFVSIPNLTQQQLEEDLDDTPDNFFEYDDHPEVPTLLNRQPCV